MPGIDESIAFVPVRIAVMTVSDTRDASNDKSGDTLAARIQDAGHVLAARKIVTDDAAKITAQLRAWIDDPMIDAVISTGGTGLTGRDVTVEAFSPCSTRRSTVFPSFSTKSASEGRNLDDPVARLRRRCQGNLSFRPARLARSGEGRLGRNPEISTRYPPQAL